MDINRIRQATVNIQYYETALKWLNEHGEDALKSASANITCFAASTCAGHREAISILESYLRKLFPEVLETAIRSCHNTIEIAQNAIREEATKE